jgi:elongation factor Tu
MQLPDGIEMVMPGDNATVAINLDKSVALDIGSHFAIREGGKSIGSRVITEVVA